MIFCYILKGKEGFYYCGITKRIADRIIQHNKGMSKSTQKKRPYTIIYTEIFTNMMQARIREKQVKNFGVERWYNKHIKF